MSSAKISIVIPVYNSAEYLADCHASLRGQTYADFEVIYVDDGSNDESAAILDGIAAADSRVRVIHQANAGTLMARQAGVAATSGEWVTFLDPDDRLSSNAFEVLAHNVPVEADILCFGVEFKADSSFDPVRLGDLDRYFNPPSEADPLPLNICGKMFRGELCRRSFADQIKTYAVFAEDIYAYSKMLAESGKPVARISEKLYLYRLEVGITGKRTLSAERYGKLLGAFRFREQVPELGDKIAADLLELLTDRVDAADRAAGLTEYVQKGGMEGLVGIICEWREKLRKQAEYITELERALQNARVSPVKRILRKLRILK